MADTFEESCLSDLASHAAHCYQGLDHHSDLYANSETAWNMLFMLAIGRSITRLSAQEGCGWRLEPSFINLASTLKPDFFGFTGADRELI